MFRASEDILHKTICITNRHLCEDDFLLRIEKIAKSGVKAVILREKDMSETEYEALAGAVMDICRKNNTLCILHSFVDVALKLNANAIHLPMPIIRALSEEERSRFDILGASCHSVEEAIEAESLGCTYITASHVFATDCKKDLKPRGLGFIGDVTKAVDILVYGLGGISEENAESVINAGAAGICIMSGFMR